MLKFIHYSVKLHIYFISAGVIITKKKILKKALLNVNFPGKQSKRQNTKPVGLNYGYFKITEFYKK
jgi:hypothetical protein